MNEKEKKIDMLTEKLLKIRLSRISNKSHCSNCLEVGHQKIKCNR